MHQRESIGPEENDRLVSEGTLKAETMSIREWKEKLERLLGVSFQGLNLTLTGDLAIDLGAANTRIYLPGNGVVINEPTVIAFDARSGKVAAVGQEAKIIARRQPREILVARPIKDGVVADCEAAGQMLSEFTRRVLTHRSLAGLSLLICVPAAFVKKWNALNRSPAAIYA